MTRRTLRPILLSLAALTLAGCSFGTASDDQTTTPDTTGSTSSTPVTASPTTATTTSSTTTTMTTAPPTTTSAAAGGCPPTAEQKPPGAPTEPTIDVDGDGRPDTQWISDQPSPDGGLPFGVTTASGATFSAVSDLAGGGSRSLLVADITGSGTLVAFTTDGRTVEINALSACSLVPIKNVDGEPYKFDRGFRGTGTGVGCIDANGDGVRDLVGLNVITDADGKATGIDRTIVNLAGPLATNGETQRLPAGDERGLELARTVTCWDLTIVDNGVSTVG